MPAHGHGGAGAGREAPRAPQLELEGVIGFGACSARRLRIPLVWASAASAAPSLAAQSPSGGARSSVLSGLASPLEAPSSSQLAPVPPYSLPLTLPPPPPRSTVLPLLIYPPPSIPRQAARSCRA